MGVWEGRGRKVAPFPLQPVPIVARGPPIDGSGLMRAHQVPHSGEANLAPPPPGGLQAS